MTSDEVDSSVNDVGSSVQDSSSPQLTCPFCGAAFRERSRFCNQCGHPLPSPDEVPSSKEVAPQVPELRCPQCGGRLRPGARFCRKCGAPTTPIETAAASQDRPTWPPPTSGFGTGSLLPMQTIAGRYLILEKIAQGGMGAIYKAQDQRLQGKIVVIKEMSETAIVPSERESVLESFTREAELLARLDHPNLVKVTDYLQEGERHYMVMEFIEGNTLQNLLESCIDPFQEEQVLDWAEQLCSVLAFLHSQSPPIVYRDMKPGNIMISEDGNQVKLIDFGIARFYKPGKRRDTIQFGTDGYAPPEQYGKAQTDARADVYALGATLHQLLTLRDPGDQLFHFDTVRRHTKSVSTRVNDAIAKAVEMNKERRHQSMEELW
ncbi:MAG: protein kinase domain-containing protein, partial [Anaerolineae bacterium]